MKKLINFTKKQSAHFLLTLCLLSTLSLAYAQRPGGASGGPAAGMNNGRFYGKVVDVNGKGVGSATVRLIGKKLNPATQIMEEALITGQITEANGDFSLDNVPVVGEFTLKVNFIGFGEVEQMVTFGIKRPEGGAPAGGAPGGGGGNWGGGSGAGAMEKDLGNISIIETGVNLETVNIEAEANTMTLALDKKVYRVDKDLMSAGGNAEDALKNVPSLSVDLDGNVSLRNGSPQIFLDGRPTTLTLDQISADAIETVEVITNPSAKYDAGGGQAGIVNIVLKKDRRIGYNGNVRTGFDTQGGYNFGGDINAREGKFNAFTGINFNNRRSNSTGETDQQNLFGSPLTNVLQSNENLSNGFFANGRAGLDWFMDNRNTLTFSVNYTRGQFANDDEITIVRDSLFTSGITTSNSLRASNSERNFRRLGTSLLFKHLFPKEGAEWTADVNVDRFRFDNDGNFNTSYFSENRETQERQNGLGSGNMITLQTDFVNPISKSIKLEGGLRANIRTNSSENSSFVFRPVESEWLQIVSLADQFSYSDNVFAAYGQFAHQFEKWGYQVGLRAESSFYDGTLDAIDSTFSIKYPLSLFPSLFITRKLNEFDNLQFAFSRRINRPNFWQTSPFTDFSDSLNIRRGNPALLPEFTNSVELSYQKIFSKGHNLLASVYYKQATDLITRYQFSEYSEVLKREVIVTSYANSSNSQAYGVELTLKNTLFKNVDLTSNVNVYNAIVDASNVESGLTAEQVSWFIKENLQVKLPAGFSLQISGEYRSKAAFTPASASERRWGGGSTNTAQGYTLANWYVDAGIRKDLFKRKASFTANISDIFGTRQNGTHTESAFFIQDTWRLRQPQVVRVNFSYRFGKMDASLFKRKNTRMNDAGGDMM